MGVACTRVVIATFIRPHLEWQKRMHLYCVNSLTPAEKVAEMAGRSMGFSYYYQTLDEEAKVRYKVKLATVGGMEDPYFTISGASSEGSVDWQDWPDVQYPDIYNYFIAAGGV